MSGCEAESPRSGIVNLGGTTAPGTAGEAVWLDFKRDAEASAGGRLELRPLIYGQLGSEEQLLAALRRGRIHFANLSAQATSTLVPEFSVLYAPYLFDSAAEADFVYDNYLTDLFREMLSAQGLHLVTWYEIGFHSVYATEPLLVPDAVRGRRFRVSAGINARLFAEALAADVIPLGYGEIVPSLQTGLIDSGENSISLYARTGIAAEAPHFSLTEHLLGVSVIVANARWWQSLPDELREILEQNFPSITRTRAAVRRQDALDLNDPSLGIQIHRLTAEQRARWKLATSEVTKVLLQRLGGRSGEVFDAIQEGKRAWRESARESSVAGGAG